MKGIDENTGLNLSQGKSYFINETSLTYLFMSFFTMVFSSSFLSLFFFFLEVNVFVKLILRFIDLLLLSVK